jgi:hypothetical protein
MGKNLRGASDIDVVQWLFDTEVFTKALNWPVHIDGLVLAKQQIDTAVQAKATPGRSICGMLRVASASTTIC